MAADVAQGLLRDAEEAERDGRREALRNFPGIQLHRNSLQSREAIALGLESVGEAQVFKYRGVKSVRKGMHVVAQSNQFVANFMHCSAVCPRPRIPFAAAGIDRQGCQALRDIVMQFAGKSRTLILVNVDQPPAEFPRLLLRSTTASAMLE